MSTTVFNRDPLASYYANQHLKTDAAVKRVLYLPKNSPEREIRFIEVNELISERGTRQLVPIDFGIDMGQSSFHSLLVVDVTPEEWDAIEQGRLSIPNGWSLDEMREFK